MINEKNIGKIYDVKKIFYIEDDEIEMLKNIYFALNEYQNIEGEYTITLNRIFSFIKNYDNSNSLINLILIKIKEFFKNKVNHHLDLYNSLQREICPILGNLLSKESLNFENIKFNYLQILEEWKLNKNNLNIQKDDYSKYGLKYINLLLERIRNLVNNKKLKISEKKFSEKLNQYYENNLKNSSEKIVREYINAINQYNKLVDQLILYSNESMKEFTKIREKYMNNFISSINKFVEKEKNQRDSILNSIIEIDSLIKNFKIEDELNEFINNNISYIDKPKKENFTSFTTLSTLYYNYDDLIKEFNEGNQIIPIIKNYISLEFPYISPYLNHENEEIKKKYNDLQNYIIQTYEGTIGNNFEKLKKYFKDQKCEEYILFFLSYLNRIRNKLVNLCQIGYENIKTLFILILDYVNKYKNYEILELVIILSQTFYRTEKGFSKILLQEDIKEHPIFKDKNIWIKNIENKLNRELNLINSENQKQNIIFSILITYKFNLANFGFNDKEINDILKDIFEKFDIKEEGNALINLNINLNKEEINKEEIKNEEIKNEEIKNEEIKNEEIKNEDKNEEIKNEEKKE